MSEETVFRSDLTGNVYYDEDEVEEFWVAVPSLGTAKLHGETERTPVNELYEKRAGGITGKPYYIVFGSTFQTTPDSDKAVIDADPVHRVLKPTSEVIGVGRKLKTSTSTSASAQLEIIAVDEASGAVTSFARQVERQIGPNIADYI